MSETNEPSKNMLTFIRAILAKSLGLDRAESLPDYKIAMIAPLVEHEFGKIASKDALIVVLRYGLSECKPLNYKQIVEVVNSFKGLTRTQAAKIVARVIEQLSTEITRLNADEQNLCLLLAGKKDARSVIDETSEATVASSVEATIERLKWILSKYNVNKFI